MRKKIVQKLYKNGCTNIISQKVTEISRWKKNCKTTLNDIDLIFEQPFFNNFCNNFRSHTHIMFLLFLSIALVFVSIPRFLCKSLFVTKVVIKIDVQITQL